MSVKTNDAGNSMAQVKNYFRSYKILSEEEIDEVLRICTIRKINKSDFFIEAGQVSRDVAFIISGTFRSFYTTRQGEDITYCIMFPDNLMAAYSSFITGQPSLENFQAITPAELLIIPKHAIEKLASANYNWLAFLKTVAEQQYLELEKRVFQLQRDSAAEKYATLLKNQPQYIQQVPLQYLASYLGITQRHLSRIRKEIVF